MAYRVALRGIKDQEEEKKKNKKDPPALQRLVNICIGREGGGRRGTNMKCSRGALGEVFPQD